MESTLIAQGAEARILVADGNIVKDRYARSYRIKEIDEPLRKQRTKREAKVLEKFAELDFPAPRLLSQEKTQLTMTLIEGNKLRDELNEDNAVKYGKEIGKKMALMHNATIIHGDLTTSNMIAHDELYFIDFGLSFFSTKEEDKAVDLHLLQEALESKHTLIWEACFDAVLQAYKADAEEADLILKRLAVVQDRGRNKKK